VLKPFIELYINYLEEIYPKELEISVSLSSKTVKKAFELFVFMNLGPQNAS